MVPTIPHGRAETMALVALLGTTISPYLFFWQAGQEVEEQHRRHLHPLGVFPRRAAVSLSRLRTDTMVGMGVTHLTALSIIIATAATLHAHGITQIASADQAALALRPIAGITRSCSCRGHHRHRAFGGPGPCGQRSLCPVGNLWLGRGAG
jgi:Mn2+/Fe2+ NRAMP family transporter